jgi:hypothetical protein
MFPSKSSETLPCVDQFIFGKIRSIVYNCIGAGLILEAEQEHKSPTWRDWIQIEAKRRSVLGLYIVFWSYCVYHCVPYSLSYATIMSIPAPASKTLWQAGNDELWKYEYSRWLSAWDGCGYTQAEFALIKEGIKLDPRSELWLEEADEFGMMYMSCGKALPAFGTHFRSNAND